MAEMVVITVVLVLWKYHRYLRCFGSISFDRPYNHSLKLDEITLDDPWYIMNKPHHLTHSVIWYQTNIMLVIYFFNDISWPHIIPRLTRMWHYSSLSQWLTAEIRKFRVSASSWMMRPKRGIRGFLHLSPHPHLSHVSHRTMGHSLTLSSSHPRVFSQVLGPHH